MELKVKMFYRFLCVVFTGLIFLSGCSGKSKSKVHTVALDNEWTTLQVPGRQSNLTGFATELLQRIGQLENINLVKVTVSWDNLLPGLLNKKYEAILSSMGPYIFNQQQFDFSELFLKTGPVLVVLSSSPITSLKALGGKEVAVMPDSTGALILEKYPGVLIRHYASAPQAFNDVIKGVIDGAIVDILTATAYCQDIYHGELAIVTPPLNDTGLRLVTLYHVKPDLIEKFNEGLDQLKSSGEYDKLLEKWGLKT
jgi:polar amino acid transport system substrate-binding protein